MASKPKPIPKKKKRVKFPWWIPALGAGVVLVLGLGIFVTMMKVEETDTFCASCHTQPESTFVGRMGAEAVDAASAHQSKQVRGAPAVGGIHCIDCHSGPGLGGRAAAMMLGARNAFMYVTKTMVQPAKLTVPIADENCLKCHADISDSEEYKGANNHFHYLLPRLKAAAPEQALNCSDCHSAHKTDVDPSILFLNKTETEAVCNRCHSVLAQ
jgi:predicted CXXCH cytochrome family protein